MSYRELDFYRPKVAFAMSEGRTAFRHKTGPAPPCNGPLSREIGVATTTYIYTPE